MAARSRRLPLRHGLGASVAIKQDWPALAGEATEAVFGRPDQGVPFTEQAMGGYGNPWASIPRPG